MDKYEFRTVLEKSLEPSDMPEYLQKELLRDFDSLMNECVHWTAEDFEMRARDIADDEWDEVYDKTKFQDALENMLRHHDAEIGITWETVRVYLNEYCRKEKKK